MSIGKQNRREAWEAIQPNLPEQYRRILAWIRSRGPLTAWDIQGLSGGLITSIRSDLTRMRQKGIVYESGSRTSIRTGRKETVFSISEQGQLPLLGKRRQTKVKILADALRRIAAMNRGDVVDAPSFAERQLIHAGEQL